MIVQSRGPGFGYPQREAEIKAGHQSLRKDIMTFLDYMIDLSVTDGYALSGRTKKYSSDKDKGGIGLGFNGLEGEK
jgi:hypothetical protein